MCFRGKACQPEMCTFVVSSPMPTLALATVKTTLSVVIAARHAACTFRWLEWRFTASFQGFPSLLNVGFHFRNGRGGEGGEGEGGEGEGEYGTAAAE